ncbi:MAG: M28 family peptidase [Armatimonadota bacterium]|nr:M28 family peptidase [Armatimonadota bacterium]MDR7519968.1 M28 family peptidase [Armatimonadota bacterium]MDR7548583.1 M28 family peptidase [Armatimonadota bacterium]
MSDAPYDRVSAQRLMADVQALSQWVRLSGTPEELEAFKYVQGRLRAAGCRTRLILHDAFISLPGAASLVATRSGGDRPSAIPCITHSFAAPTGPDGVEAEALYVGSGTPQALSASGPAGTIVLVDGLATPARVRDGESAGAAGLVFLNRDPVVHEMIVSPVWGSPAPDDLARLPRLPVVSVARAEGARLRAMARAGGLRLRITAQVDTRWRKTPLLTGDLPGAVEDTFVLVSGHLDSWHRGAMDNGTANATMLEIARLMARARRYRGIRFAFWSGHSHGRYSGSAWYADHFWHDLHTRCAVHINVDSTGGRGAVINRYGYAMPETRGVADRVLQALTGDRFEGSPVGRMGDQSFLGVGVPSLLMDVSEQPSDSPDASADFSVRTGGATGGLGWWWHTTEDLPDKIDPDVLVRDCRIYLGIVHAFATEAILPLDYGATARRWQAALRALPRSVGRHVDLRPVVAEAQRLVDATGTLERTIRRARAVPSRRAARAANAALLAMGRALIPIGYTEAGPFHPDPALEMPEMPVLAAVRALGGAAGDEAKHLAVRAVRDLNAVRHALAQAADAADDGTRTVRDALSRSRR